MAEQSEPLLLGVELGRNKVRLALLDEQAHELIDIVQRPIAKTGGPRHPLDQEPSMVAALGAALDRLGAWAEIGPVAASIGFANCGVGSGPALRGWLESMSDGLGEPIVCAGLTGISYAPAWCVELVERVFAGCGLTLTRVELAPVAASRVLEPLPAGGFSLGSGVAWRARIHQGEVLEAFETPDGPFDEAVQVEAAGFTGPLADLHGVHVDSGLCRSRGVRPEDLAPAVGAALSLLMTDEANLLRAAVIGNLPQLATGHERAPGSDDTYQLQRAPETVARSRPVGADPARGQRAGAHPAPADEGRARPRPVPIDRGHELDPVSPEFDDLAGIEAFAHPGDPPPRTFHLAEFVMGAVGMLAIVLAVLVILR